MRLEDRYPSLLVSAIGAPSGGAGAFLPFSFELSLGLGRGGRVDPLGTVVTRYLESGLLAQELHRILVEMLELMPLHDQRQADTHKRARWLQSQARDLGVALEAFPPGDFMLDHAPEEIVREYGHPRSFASAQPSTRLRHPEGAVLGMGLSRVVAGPQLVALARNLGSARDLSVLGICGELWLHHFEFTAGSVDGKGSGALVWIAGTILVPLAIAAFGKEITDPAKEAISRIQIQHRLQSLRGQCVVKGHVQLELQPLMRSFEASISSKGSRAVCVEQAALAIVGRHPGPIDGVEGPQTESARQTFKQQWGVVDKVPVSQEYIAALLKALRGVQPPAK